MREQTRSRIATGLERAGLLGPVARMREGWLSLRAGRGPEIGPDGLPLPPPRLRLLVDGRSAGAEHYLQVGAQMFSSIRAAVADAGTPAEQLGSVLDFGCGCGRVARYWTGVDGPELSGCDYNGDLTGWCEANLPFMRVAKNDVAPPTPYESQSFDLIYALSVLSHLDRPLQEGWVNEFRRLLRPGGLLVISVLGEMVRHRLSPEQSERFARGELIVERPRMAGRNLCTAYHPESFVRDDLLADFAEVRRFELGSPELVMSQDAYLARVP
ncbi:MAG TPA: class I SAM-dependent methyltransferase [Solirubrobacterales bacterium]